PPADPDLAAARELFERASLPITDRSFAAFVEALELEWLAIEPLECRKLQTELEALRCAPGGLAVDHDQIRAAAGGFVLPPHFQTSLGILGVQHGGHQLLALGGVDLREHDVLRLVGGCELQVA